MKLKLSMLLTAVDLVVPVQTNIINPAIKELQDKITLEMAGIKDDNQEHYITGLSDALDIIIHNLNEQLTVGSEYYVVMPEDAVTNKVVKMRLYKITQKNKFYYSFTTAKQLNCLTNDLTLSNLQSIKMRVFKTEEEAEKHKSIMIWRREFRNLFNRYNIS